MVLWPRFEACICRCVRICVRYVSLSPASRRYAVMWGSAEQKCRASNNLWRWGCFTPLKRNNEVTESKAADKCARCGTSEFQCFCCVWLFTPLIYTFMRKRKVPFRISVREKLLSLNNQKAEKSNRQKPLKKKSGIITGNHVMDYLVHWHDGWGVGGNYGLFYFTLPACCCVPATLFCC